MYNQSLESIQENIKNIDEYKNNIRSHFDDIQDLTQLSVLSCVRSIIDDMIYRLAMQINMRHNETFEDNFYSRVLKKEYEQLKLYDKDVTNLFKVAFNIKCQYQCHIWISRHKNINVHTELFNKYIKTDYNNVTMFINYNYNLLRDLVIYQVALQKIKYGVIAYDLLRYAVCYELFKISNYQSIPFDKINQQINDVLSEPGLWDKVEEVAAKVNVDIKFCKPERQKKIKIPTGKKLFLKNIKENKDYLLSMMAEYETRKDFIDDIKEQYDISPVTLKRIFSQHGITRDYNKK